MLRQCGSIKIESQVNFKTRNDIIPSEISELSHQLPLSCVLPPAWHDQRRGHRTSFKRSRGGGKNQLSRSQLWLTSRNARNLELKRTSKQTRPGAAMLAMYAGDASGLRAILMHQAAPLTRGTAQCPKSLWYSRWHCQCPLSLETIQTAMCMQILPSKMRLGACQTDAPTRRWPSSCP